EMLDITNIIEDIHKVIEKSSYTAKRQMLSRLGSNLVWNDEKLSISAKESINILVNGIKDIKLNNPKFEPKKYIVLYDSNKKTESFDPVFSTMLRG
ncbi:MAG: hypothetical protein KBB54_02740, partial [Candidatus Pacebacteria bacterium]|nr:hypothetical protein [Candidatus Paceibacterota bacterium]